MIIFKQNTSTKCMHLISFLILASIKLKKSDLMLTNSGKIPFDFERK